jgi:hypothetical protein
MADSARKSDVGAINPGRTLMGEAIERTVERAEDYTGAQLLLFEPGAPLPNDAHTEQGPRSGRPGRPPGAGNKSTEAFRRFVRGRYGDPGLRLIERIFADPLVLARVLQAKPWEVVKAQSEWALRILPFFWAQMPAELKLRSEGYLAVGISGEPNGLEPGDKVVEGEPFAALLRLAQNQGLRDIAAGPSNDDGSNGQAETPDETET